MSALNDYRAIWQAAFVQRQPRVAAFAKWIAVLLPPLGAVAGVARHDWVLAARIGVDLPAVLLLMMWAMLFVPGAALMNTPANARLVPRMRRRLVEMTAAGWACSALVAMLILDWHASPLIVLYVIGMSTARSGSKIGGWLMMSACFWTLIARAVPPGLIVFLMTVPGYFCAMTCVLLFGAYAIGVVLPAGGERHWRQRTRQAETINRLESLGRTQPKLRITRLRSVYGYLLRDACSKRLANRLLLHTLGPAVHWTMLLPLCVGLLALAIGAMALLHWFVSPNSHESLTLLGWILLMTLLLFVYYACVDQYRTSIATAKDEAALFRLSARAPKAEELNRILAGELVRNTLLCWLTVAGTILLVTVLSGASAQVLIAHASLCTLPLVPGLAWTLHDYARDDGRLRFGRFLLPLFAGVLFVVAALVLHAFIGAGAWPLLALFANGVAIPVAYSRWKRMLAAPVAFPAGRLA